MFTNVFLVLAGVQTHLQVLFCLLLLSNSQQNLYSVLLFLKYNSDQCKTLFSFLSFTLDLSRRATLKRKHFLIGEVAAFQILATGMREAFSNKRIIAKQLAGGSPGRGREAGELALARQTIKLVLNTFPCEGNLLLPEARAKGDHFPLEPG